MSRKFLIGQLASFGDCLYATTIAKQIKQDYPGSHVTWAVSTQYKSALLLNPHVDAIWEITDPQRAYYTSTWKNFEKEAEERRANGEFDEIIYSQVYPKNSFRYNGTIRGSILATYKRPITVDKRAEVNLTETEIANVRQFAEKYALRNFKHVVLFECEPTSAQSNLNLAFAIKVARHFTSQQKDICFILSSPKKLGFSDPQILDGSEISFRENAELTHYCTFLIGCSSGITWLAASGWAKDLPSLQLLNASYLYFAGVHYDYELSGLDNSRIVERINFDQDTVIAMLEMYFEKGIAALKQAYHQVYKVDYTYSKWIIRFGLQNYKLFKTIGYVLRQRNNPHGLKMNKILGIFFKDLVLVSMQKMVAVVKLLTGRRAARAVNNQ